MKPLNVAITYPNHAVLTTTVVALEMLTEANNFSRVLKMEREPFRIQLFGENKKMEHQHGKATFFCKTFDHSPQDVVIVTAVKGDPECIFRDNQELITFIRYHNERGTTIVGICSGALLLAEAGILRHKKAATHWAHSDLVTRKFPEVHFEYDKPFIDLGNIVTSTGAFSANSVILYLIEKYGNRDLALFTSRMYLTDYHLENLHYFIPIDLKLNHGNQKVLSIQNFIIDSFSQELSIARLAKQFEMSHRNLTKMFKKTISVNPSQYVQRVRIKKAASMLENGNKNVKEIMFSVGYNDRSAFRKIFKKLVGLNPTDYRDKFKVIKIVTPN
jgi:transcriptional regulator GlxA family with amidase domain